MHCNVHIRTHMPACNATCPTAHICLHALQRAQELKQEEEELKEKQSRNFAAGKYLYERGEYAEAVQRLETAVKDTGTESSLGGEVQLWLALAYQAVGREAEAGEVRQSWMAGG